MKFLDKVDNLKSQPKEKKRNKKFEVLVLP